MNSENFLSRQWQKAIRFCFQFFYAPRNLKKIPIIINNFNRLSCLRTLIQRLQSDGYLNIYVLDNASTYPPLLEYYDSNNDQIEVLRLSENLGYLALWKSKYWKKFKNSFYVYTDPDVVPSEDCPGDYIEHFYSVLTEHLSLEKIGFSLDITDLPDSFAHKDEVILHEKKFWSQKNEFGFYNAPIDTTFALYRPRSQGGYWCTAWRSPEPYIAKHLPWYEDSANLSEESKFYKELVSESTHWSQKKD